MLYNELDRTTNRFHFVLILTSALNPTAALNHSAAAATATHSTAAAALIFDTPPQDGHHWNEYSRFSSWQLRL